MLIPKRVFELSALCSEAFNRPGITGIFFTREAGKKETKPVAVATDGVYLAKLSWPEEDRSNYPAIPGLVTEFTPGFKAIIPSEVCQEAKKLSPKNYLISVLGDVLLDESVKEPDCKLSGYDLKSIRSLETKQCDGNFPDYAAVLADLSDEHYVSMELNAKALITLLQTLQKTLVHGPGLNKVVLMVPKYPKIQPENICSLPFMVKAKDFEGFEFTGVLMPLKEIK